MTLNYQKLRDKFLAIEIFFNPLRRCICITAKKAIKYLTEFPYLKFFLQLFCFIYRYMCKLILVIVWIISIILAFSSMWWPAAILVTFFITNLMEAPFRNYYAPDLTGIRAVRQIMGQETVPDDTELAGSIRENFDKLIKSISPSVENTFRRYGWTAKTPVSSVQPADLPPRYAQIEDIGSKVADIAEEAKILSDRAYELACNMDKGSSVKPFKGMAKEIKQRLEEETATIPDAQNNINSLLKAIRSVEKNPKPAAGDAINFNDKVVPLFEELRQMDVSTDATPKKVISKLENVRKHINDELFSNRQTGSPTRGLGNFLKIFDETVDSRVLDALKNGDTNAQQALNKFKESRELYWDWAFKYTVADMMEEYASAAKDGGQTVSAQEVGEATLDMQDLIVSIQVAPIVNTLKTMLPKEDIQKISREIISGVIAPINNPNVTSSEAKQFIKNWQNFKNNNDALFKNWLIEEDVKSTLDDLSKYYAHRFK